MASIRVDEDGVQVVVAASDPGSESAEDTRRAALLMPREEFAPSADSDGNAVIDMLASKMPESLAPTTH